MAGSLKWFIYTTDNGQDFALWADESNLEVVNGGTQDFPNNGTVLYALPRNVKPRKIRFRNAAGTVQRNIVALTPTIFAGVSGTSSYTDPVSGETLIIAGKVGEAIRVPIGIDTGLIDGDAT
jgi:hypothetical protein